MGRRREFINIEKDDDSSQSDTEDEAVLNLGKSVISSSSESSSDSSTSGDDNSLGEPDSESGDSSDMEDITENWGSRKEAYYHGDTADLEIGQEEEDAHLEEEAAREVQKRSLSRMNEEDFMNDIEESNAQEGDDPDVGQTKPVEQRTKLRRNHRELLHLLSHFSNMADMSSITKAIFEDGLSKKDVPHEMEVIISYEDDLGMTKSGKQFLLFQDMMTTTSLLHVVAYMLLEYQSLGEEESSISSHPVSDALGKLFGMKKMLEDEPLHDSIASQQKLLLRTVELSKEMDTESVTENQDIESDVELVNDSAGTSTDSVRLEEVPPVKLGSRRVRKSAKSYQVVMTPFDVQQSDLEAIEKKTGMANDYGDGNERDAQLLKTYQRELNTLQQKTTAKSKEASHHEIETMDVGPDDTGPSFDNGVGDEVSGDHSVSSMLEDEFYSAATARSRSQKAARSDKYRVAPSYPKVDRLLDGERAISKTILKNRGLVAHKSKLNRNPRVKKREQYRKATIRRKGAVRTIRKDETHGYAGETTGIKVGVTRSKRLS